VSYPSAASGSVDPFAARDPRSYTPDRLAERMLAAGRVLEGERKLVTVLFADVVGSMDLAERLGPEDWRRVMGRCFAILCEGIHRFEGMVEQFTGDGLMALFGAPLAQEDHAARACHAALRLLEQLGGYSAELRRGRGLDFAVRIGLNSGEVVTGAIGDDLTLHYTATGHTVGLARRIESLAAPNAAFVSQRTAALVEGFFDLRDRGLRELKGVREPVRVYEVAGLGRLRTHLDVSRERGLSRFVDRERELAALESALARASEGSGQVVGIVAEAGAGKSRLCYEFAERCRARGIEVWSAQCTSRGVRQPLLLLRELLCSCFGITELDTKRAAREKVAGRISLLGRSLDTDLSPIVELLGISDRTSPAGRTQPEERERSLVQAVTGLLLRWPTEGPRVMVVEELRWIDPPSERFIKRLVERLAGTPTLLIATFRPEYRADWLRGAHHTRLPLAPLDRGAVDDLLRDRLGNHPSVAGLAEHVSARAEGNPFFLEELVHGMAESNRLAGKRGAYRLVGAIDDTVIPSSVQSVVAARIDRLSERDRAVLHSAAVIGYEFSERLLELVAGLPERELLAALQALVAAELVVERPASPDRRYAFRHHLIEELAYRSELAERRARIHGAVASALERLYPDRRDELAGLIAHHLEEAAEEPHAAP
jgi:class 3 adenylate cyclase